jgi:DNA ligase-1
VFKLFRDIATTTGASSQARKLGLISKLLVASKGTEPGYIMRSLQVGSEGETVAGSRFCAVVVIYAHFLFVGP